MADQKITELTALTTPTTDDLLVIVDDPAGSPVTKKISLAALIATLLVSNVVVQVKTSGSGTYTPTAGMKKVLVICVGGGGGAPAETGLDAAVSGGGAGGCAIKLFDAATMLETGDRLLLDVAVSGTLWRPFYATPLFAGAVRARFRSEGEIGIPGPARCRGCRACGRHSDGPRIASRSPSPSSPTLARSTRRRRSRRRGSASPTPSSCSRRSARSAPRRRSSGTQPSWSSRAARSR